MNKVRLFGFYFPVLFAVLAVSELCIIVAAIFLAAYLRFNGDTGEIADVLGPMDYRGLFAAVILSVSMGAMGLYQSNAYEGLTGQLLRATVAFLLGSIALAVLYYALPELYMGRGMFVMASVLALGGIALLRIGFFRLVDMDRLKPVVLVYGAGRTARWLKERLAQRGACRGVRLLGFVEVDGQRDPGLSGARVFSINGAIVDFAKRNLVDEIVIAVDDRRNHLPMDELLQCRLEGIAVLDRASFLERETGSVDLEAADPSWLIFGQGFRYGITLGLVKRALDICFSLVLLAVTTPILIATFVAIKLEDGPRAPVLYSQVRVGKRGRLFKLYKVRSMRVDAESGGARWAGEGDPRVTRVGHVIRKLRIDEAPQVLNVLRGDMSFVGPRPERPEFTRDFENSIRYYRERASVKPGITGWAQLRYPYGASETDAQEKLKYDLFYIKNHNTILDILILLLTVEVVLFGKGAR